MDGKLLQGGREYMGFERVHGEISTMNFLCLYH